MIIAAAILLTVAVVVFTLSVRTKDLPEPPPPSPFQRQDEVRARVYENLRDLQFEYRLGKLSDEDYQRTKLDLQKELASVMAEIEKLQQELGVKAAVKPAARAADPLVCPHCQAKLPKAMKFCGECGKPVGAGA